VIDWLRTGPESPKNSKNYMPEEKINEETVKEGFTLVRKSGSPLESVVILGQCYGFCEGKALYKRVELSGLAEFTPILDYRLGGLEQVLPSLVSGDRRIANEEELREIILNSLPEGRPKSPRFLDRVYLFENSLPLLHGTLPQSIKDKYGVK
jgi:hypothetical protein